MVNKYPFSSKPLSFAISTSYITFPFPYKGIFFNSELLVPFKRILVFYLNSQIFNSISILFYENWMI